MQEILNRLSVVLDECERKSGALNVELESVRRTAADLKVREDRVTAIASAQVLLDEFKAAKDANYKLIEELAVKRAEFDSWVKQEKQAVVDERATLSPLRDQQAELVRDRANLIEREKALEVEKASYKERIKRELKQHFQNTMGAAE